MSNRALVGAVTSYANNGSGSTIPFSARAVRAGSLLVAMVRSESAQRTTTWSDTAGGIWTSFDNFQSDINCSIAYSWNHPGGSAVSVTATLSGANSYRYGELVELEGPDAVDPVGFITRLNSTTTQRVWAQHRPRSDLLFGVAVYNGGSVFPVPPDAVQVNKGPYHALLMRRATGGGSSLVSGGDYVTDTAGVVLEIRDRSARRWRARRGAVSAGGGGTTISATPGNAAADGTTASVTRTIPATPGNASADGITASVVRVIGATPGNAVADGTTAAVTRSIAATPGNAVADGVTATVTNSGTTTISCTPGNAAADGALAAITRTIAAAPGNAVANGAIAALLRVIATTPGNAVADGVTAAVQASVTISCTPGNAVADGVAATVTAAVSQLDLILKILVNRQELNPATGTFTLYDDDATTVLYTTNAWADAAGTVPYSGGALRRIDALI